MTPNTDSPISDRRAGLTDVLAEGRAAGLLNRRVSAGILLDYVYGVLARLIQMAPLTEQTNELFEMLWRAIAAPPDFGTGIRTIDHV